MKESKLVLIHLRGQAGGTPSKEGTEMIGIELVIAAALFAPVVWLLETTHRRTRDLPQLPLGTAAQSEAAARYRRQMAELRQLSQLSAPSGPGVSRGSGDRSEIDPRVRLCDRAAER